MIKYKVRSNQLIDVVGDIKRKKIQLSPYFQRNLVWRLVHKQDFIKTILLGYPFPQIFLAKGGMNVEELSTISLVVDGQQRLNSIIDYIDNKFTVDGRHYRDLTPSMQEEFLRYEVAIIELQLEGEDPEIKEIFKRLNRTFYSLTNIEKLSTEYAPSEFMLTAKLLTGQLEIKSPSKSGEFELDPNIPPSFVEWAKTKKNSDYTKLVLSTEVFSAHEVARQVPLQFTLNVLGTITKGFFNRNISDSLLEDYSEEFPEKEEMFDRLNAVANKLSSLELPADSYWHNKANLFSLIVLFYRNHDELIEKSTKNISTTLKKFERNLPEDFSLAAREAVNNKKERQLRNEHLEKIFGL